MPDEPFDSDATLRAMAAGQCVLRKRYTLLRVLGRGGMGVVWLARDETLKDEVALKFLPEAVIHDAASIHDLKHETQRSLKLTHPNIVRIHGFVEDEDRTAISMEYVDGATLVKRRLEQPSSVFTPETILPFIKQITEALDYAHNRAKVVHRDIKPANLLISSENEVKIADFGISATLTDTATRLSRRDSSSSGSPPYMSPQQMMGEKPSIADDIYALGATIYELLTSKPPFHSGNLLAQVQTKIPQTLQQRRAELLGTAADNLPPIPANWEKTIASCLAKDPAKRPASVRAMLDGLEGKTATPAAPVKPAELPLPPPAPKTDVTAKGSRTWLWALIAVVILGLGAAAWLTLEHNKGTPAANPSTGTTPSVTTSATPVATPQPTPAERAPFIIAVDPVVPNTRLWLGQQGEVPVNNGRLELKGLPPGEQELTVQAPGHQVYITRVTVPAAGGGASEVKLVPIRGTVELKGRPGTLVTARDATGRTQDVGTIGPDGSVTSEGSLAVGDYSFVFKHPDYATVEMPGSLVVGQRLQLSANQSALGAELRIFTSPTGAAVTVNGQPAGVTPATLRNQPSEAVLTIGVRLHGYRPTEQTVTLKPNEIRTLNLPPLASEAGTLHLQVTPLEAADAISLTIDGRPINHDSGTLRDLEIGKHTLTLTHPDYKPWSGEAEVRDKETTNIPISLNPKPGTLAFTTSPGGAIVRVTGGELKDKPWKDTNGQESTTPFKGTLAPGDYTLGFSLAGYKPAERQVVVSANREQSVSVILEKIPEAPPTPKPVPGVIRPQITPYEAGAATSFLIDGQPVAFQGNELRNLSPGKHTVQATHPDYKPWSAEIEVRNGDTTSLPVVLIPKPGSLSFESTPPGATVRITGGSLQSTTWKDAAGRETVTPFKGSVPPGDYALSFTLNGYQPATRNVTVTPNHEETVSAVMELIPVKKAVPVVGSLRISISPSVAGAAYTLDGIPVTPQAGELRNLTGGRHSLTVSHPDFEFWSGVALVQNGESSTVYVTLTAKPVDASADDLVSRRRRSAR
jgi:serine/threonine protein kinase/proteasome lid subunit RPN8/RPN11